MARKRQEHNPAAEPQEPGCVSGCIPLPLHQEPIHISPTDLSQFLHLGQCQRYLRFRLAEHAGQKFMRAYGVSYQRLTPLLTQAGRQFEQQVEEHIRQAGLQVRHFQHEPDQDVINDNQAVIDTAYTLPPGQVLVFFQPRLKAIVNGRHLRGDVDILRLERQPEGALHILIVDMKSSTTVRVQHRVQVACYQRMLERIFQDAGLPQPEISLGILYRLSAVADPDKERIRSHRDAACRWFRLHDLQQALLEILTPEDCQVYCREVDHLLSLAGQVAAAPFEDLPFVLSVKCDGCLYNEYCMKWCAEHDDLSLLPYISASEKKVLQQAGIHTIRELAYLADWRQGNGWSTLLPAPGQEERMQQLAATWPVGPRLEELVLRARAFRRLVHGEPLGAPAYIPARGTSSLAISTPERNPNLVRIYVDAQNDYLTERVYLLSAQVVAYENGNPARRGFVIHLADQPVTTAEQERELLVRWSQELLYCVVQLAAPQNGNRRAPIHFVFFDRQEQELLLSALARNLPYLLNGIPALYDLLTQRAACDAPIATFLDEEIRTFKNFPLTCQSLQSLATYLKFNWDQPQPFRQLFHDRLFDYAGQLEQNGEMRWYTRRSRFSSQIPLEYAYAVWGQLPPAERPQDPLRDYRRITREQLLAFQRRRLEALEHIANSLTGNPFTEKTPFNLPELAQHEDRARNLAQALEEFLTIERHVALARWRQLRHIAPEQRMLSGETLLVSYHDEDQEPEVAQQMQELRRQQPAGQKWKWDNLTIRLRLEAADTGVALEELLARSNFQPGDYLILAPRWAVDNRQPAAQQQPFTPTVKQLLYYSRCRLKRVILPDQTGAPAVAQVEVTLCDSWLKNNQGHNFVFSDFLKRPLEPGQQYTLDPSPDDRHGLNCYMSVQKIQNGEQNTLYDYLTRALPQHPPEEKAVAAQHRFLEGLGAFQQQGLFHDLEESKRQFIGGHSAAPILLVQGPPGTGKTHSTALALLARLQAALCTGQACRVFVSCKTHSATDILLQEIHKVRQRLQEWNQRQPNLFRQYFDEHLLALPLYRFDPRGELSEGIQGLKENARLPKKHRCLIVGATPGGIHRLLKSNKNQKLCDLLVLDEASQMSLPEALLAAQPLEPGGRVIVVGDHRQMPPIVHHDWSREPRRTFREYEVYRSLFEYLWQRPDIPRIQFTESFRLHACMAEFLHQEIYYQDGIHFHSNQQELLKLQQSGLPEPLRHEAEFDFIQAALRPDYPLVVVVHEEAASQIRNPFEQYLSELLIRALQHQFALDGKTGLGIVVPHRAQRAVLQLVFPELRQAIDTVERFQGGERRAILISATESDVDYLLEAGDFLFDPRRLTVALSRARCKLLLLASRAVFTFLSSEEEVFRKTFLWKNLLYRTCTELLWRGQLQGYPVEVWGRRAE
jgi:hypothetical protein